MKIKENHTLLIISIKTSLICKANIFLSYLFFIIYDFEKDSHQTYLKKKTVERLFSPSFDSILLLEKFTLRAGVSLTLFNCINL